MKEKVQARIDHMRAQANGPVVTRDNDNGQVRRSGDSLSQAVRNGKEADRFVADLNAAFEVARRKKG